MGTYVNPGNQAFKRISGPNYVDKTGMIRLINERIGGDDSLVCCRCKKPQSEKTMQKETSRWGYI